MKNIKKIYALVFVLSLLLIFSCKSDSKIDTQKTPKELSDEARIMQAKMNDSIQAIVSMKEELTELRKIKREIAEKPCNCPEKSFKANGQYSWVYFEMPKGKKNQKISIRNGSYKTPLFHKGSLACSRVFWTNLVFRCNPTSCKWERISGYWKSSNHCLGTPASSGKISYVRTRSY